LTPLLFTCLSIAGGIGASTRFLFDGAIRSRITVGYPLGTTIINVSGSFLLGLVAGLALGEVVNPQWQLIVGTGFLGGYTTFSTASFETIRLAQERRYGAALTNGLGMLIGAVAAAGLGLWIGANG
jgi:CrcB protein